MTLSACGTQYAQFRNTIQRAYVGCICGVSMAVGSEWKHHAFKYPLDRILLQYLS